MKKRDLERERGGAKATQPGRAAASAAQLARLPVVLGAVKR